MPIPLLNAYASGVSRISAAESLQAAERIAVGSGTLKKGVGRRIATGWQRQAEPRRHVIRPTSPEAEAALLAGMGIAVKRVKVGG